MGVSWNPDFLYTVPGMAMAAQVVGSLIGGLVNIVWGGLAIGLLAFAFWSTFVISGVLTLAHVCNMAQSIEAKFPYFSKLQLGYVLIWGLMFLVASILTFIGWGLSAIFGYLVLVAFLVDAFFKYRNYRAAVSATAEAVGGGAPAAEAGSAQK